MGEADAPILRSWNKNHWSVYVYINDMKGMELLAIKSYTWILSLKLKKLEF
jgi:hypothetical protein